MTIYTPDGSEVKTAKKRDLEPGPGQALVIRSEVDKKVGSFDKPLEVIEQEERFNIYAQIVRVGPGRRIDANLVEEPWFKSGDIVIVQPTLLTQIEMDNGSSVWLCPFGAIKGKFVESDDLSN